MKQRVVRIVAALAVTGCPALILGAQTATYTAGRPSAAAIGQREGSPLERRVTLDLKKVTLDDALAEIDRQADLGLSYSPRTVPVARIVSLHVKNVPALQALETALAGTSVRVTLGATGQVVLVRDVAAADSVAGGELTGAVVEAATKSVVTGAVVQIVGTKITASTQANGSYRLVGIPAGTHTVRITRIGYQPKEVSALIREGQATTLRIEMNTLSIKLNDVITTTAGSQKRLELGNSIATIKADSVVRNSPINNLSDLLAARAPGVVVMSNSGAVGSGSRIRIRGIGGLTNSDSILIVDGVRMDANYSDQTSLSGTSSKQYNRASPAGVAQGTASSRLDDIDPNSIESIEVLKGPSAATLYGSDAANGVIVIKTKSGQAGPARWSFTGQRGILQMKAKFPDSYVGYGTSPIYGSGAQCTINDLVIGNCSSIDSVSHFDPLNNAHTTPFGNGWTTNLGAQVSGGNQQLLYFLGATAENTTGVLKMPDADAQILADQTHGRALPEWARHPNTFTKQSGQGRTTINLGTTGTASLTSLITHQVQSNVGDAGTSPVVGLARVGSGDPNVNDGWPLGNARPWNIFTGKTSSAETRGTVSLNTTWTPSTWFNGRAIVGADYGDRTDEFLAMRGDTVYNVFPLGGGMRGHVEMGTTIYSLDVGGTATVPVNDALKLQTAAGVQGQHTYNKTLAGNGTGLPAGGTTVNSATTIVLAESYDQNITAGWYIQETANLRERMFLTAGLRQDGASTFGVDIAPVYPKFSFSWLVSQEPFFPQLNALSSLRLRAAYGHAGVQPSTTGAIRTFTPGTGYVDGTVVPISSISSIGNTKLRPQRGTELEVGGDISLLDDRFTIEGTYYRKIARDALVSPQVPPSFGYPIVSPAQQNIGIVSNTGVEWAVTGTPYTSYPVTWDFNLGLSTNRNRLRKLNNDIVLQNINNSPQGANVVGYPLFGLWARPILGYNDLNGDGVIAPSEVAIGDSLVFIGAPTPTRELSLTNTVGFFNNRLRVSAMIDYQGGMGTQDNASMTAAMYSRGAVDPNAPLSEQAAVAALRVFPKQTAWAYDGTVSFTRLRELTFSYDVPVRFANRLHAQSLTVLLMGENLKLWSDYHGADPGVNTGPQTNNFQDFGGMPLTRNWTLRFNLGF